MRDKSIKAGGKKIFCVKNNAAKENLAESFAPMILASVLFFLAFVYAWIMFTYYRAWQALPAWCLPAGFLPDIPVTVIIAARNEADNIINCLRSILNGAYPPKLLEIIVVDDFSEDETAALVRQFIEKRTGESALTLSIKLLQLSAFLLPAARFTANKKKAIERAVAQASGAIIVTTDADCLAPVDWLCLITSCFSSNAHLSILAAPVAFHREMNLLQRFQALDFLGLMGITGAGIQLGWHRMGNGANLAYRKSAFEAVGGFSGNAQVASGDDMFLIQKMAAKWPGSVRFLKNPAATVHTTAKATWQEFWQQRLRWGTKNAALPEWRMKAILLVVWLFCWSILLVWGAVLFGLLSWQVLACQLLVKASADWLLLREMCQYFKRKDLLRWFLPSFFIHTAYIALVGLGSLFFKKYTWKGRVVGLYCCVHLIIW